MWGNHHYRQTILAGLKEERRRAPRWRDGLRTYVRPYVAGKSLPGTGKPVEIVDAAQDGLCLASDEPARVGSELWIRIPYRKGARRERVRVMWCATPAAESAARPIYRMGVRFTTMTDRRQWLAYCQMLEASHAPGS